MITKYKTDRLPCRRYKALLTQTGPLTSATSLSNFSGKFIIGEEYTITNYVSGDDFSNIANVTSGVINTTGCIFTATGQIPENWSNGSTLDSTGGLVVTELENSLGFGIIWSWAPFGGSGYYIGMEDEGPNENSFPRDKTTINVQSNYVYDSPFYNYLVTGVSSFMDEDNIIYIDSQDLTNPMTLLDNTLYYTSITVEVYP